MSDFAGPSIQRAIQREDANENKKLVSGLENPASVNIGERPQQLNDSQYFRDLVRGYDDAAIDKSIRDYASTQSNPEDIWNRWEEAKEYAKVYNVDPQVAFNSLEAWRAEYWGEHQIGKTFGKAVADTFSAGWKAIERGRLGNELANRLMLDPNDTGMSWMGPMSNPEGNKKRKEELKLQIAEISDEMRKLSTDILPRSWLQSAVKIGISSVPYTLEFAKQAVIAGLISTASGGLGAGAALKAFISESYQLVQSTRVLQGMEYVDMVANGVDEVDAIGWSYVSGAMQAITERLLGIEGMISEVATKTPLKSLSGYIVKKLHAGGSIASLGAAFGKRALIGTASEMVEEGGQALESGLMKMGAEAQAERKALARQRAIDDVEKAIVEHRVIEEKMGWNPVIQNPTTVRSIATEMVDGMIGAALSFPLLGLAPSFLAARQDIAQLENFAKIAPKMPKDAFQNLGDSLGLLPDISPEARSEAFGQMYDTALTRDKEYKERLAVEGKRRPGLGQDTVIERHGPEDSILMTAATGGETDSGIAARMQFGTRNDRAQYGGIDIRFDGNTVVFEGAELTEGYEAIVDEAISQIMERFQGRDFRVSEDANYLLQGAFERVSKGQDEIKADVVRAKNAAEKQVVYEEIARAMPAWTESEVKSAADIFELVAGMTGTSIGKLRSAFNESDFIVSKSNMGKAAGSFVTMATSNISLQRAHQVMTRRARGEQILDATEQLVHAHIRLRKDEKLDTFLHEMLHFAEAVMEGDPIMEKIRDHYGRRLDRHAVSEKFVADVMAVMSSQGGLDTLNYAPEVKSIIKTIADFLKKVWHILAEGGSVDPKVEAEIIRMLDRAANIYGKPTTTSDVMPDYIYEQVLKTQGGIQDSDIKVVEEYLSGILENVNSFIAHSRGANKVTAVQYHNAIVARLKKVRDGTWKNDPQLIVAMKAYIDKQNGAEMDEYVAGCVDIAKMGMDVDGMSYDGMDEATIILSALDIFKNDAQREQVKQEQEEELRKEAKSFSSWQDWVDYLFPGIDMKTLTEQERNYYRQTWEYAKRDVKPKYAKGELVKYLANPSNMYGLLREAAKAIQEAETSTDEVVKRHGQEIRDAISETPELLSAINKIIKGDGIRRPNPELLSAADRKAIVDLTRKNESLIKFFLARVSGDTDLAFEAQAELGRIPESQKYNFFARPGRTIAEQASILEAIQDEEIREKILDGTITEKELNEFMRKKYRETRDRERKKGEEKLKAFKDRVKERDAARKLHAQIRKLREFIMRPPSTGIGNKAYQYIRFIQEYLEKGRPVDVTKLRNAASVVFVNQPGAAEGLVKLLSSLSNRQFNEFTLNELQTLSDMFDNWMRKGRAELRSKQYEAHIEMKVLRDLALDSFKNNKYFKKEMKTYQSQEMRDQADSFWTRLRQVAIDHMRPDAFYRKYFDGMQNGKSMEIFTDLLCDQVMQGQHAKLSQYARRTDHIMDFIRDKSNDMYNSAGQVINEDGIGLDRRIVLEGIGVEDSDFTVSANDLIGISMLIGTKTEFSQSQREAFIYGVLFSENEKNPSGSEFGMGGDRNAYMMKKYEEKLNGLLDAINANLTRKEWELRNMMMEVLNTPDDWVRFANGVIEMTGKEPTFEKYYFPIVRQTMVDYAEDEILDKTKFGSGNKAKYVEAFMTLDRSRKIQPRNQKPVKYNGTQVFFDAVMRQEHLTNMGPLVKKLNGIFHSNVFSDILRGNIRNSLGQQALDYLDSHLEAVAAPLAPRERIPGESSLSLARGGVIIGNLAWRWSSILMQLTTSPLPFLSEAPGELMAVAAEAWASGHPIKWYQEIEEKSSELKYRQMDNVHAEITGLQEKGFTGNFKRFAQAGMLGLYHVDRLSVAIGWEAVYRKKFREFHAQMNEESATRMAKEYADKVVARTQPSVDPTQRAPVYRNQNEFQKLIYQFTQPLNVIWNNIAYDMPQALKEREYGRFLGFLAGYALSGLAVGATRALRGRGPKEDEDDERNARRWAQFWMYSASTQFLEAVPLAGDMISSLMRAFITGESRLMGDTNMPAMGLLYEAMSGILKAQKDGEWTGQEIEKVLGTAAYGTLMAVGAPALGIRETVEAAKKVAGIGDKE